MLVKLQVGLASILVIGGAIATSAERAIAQIVPDATLGAESSVVTPQAPGSNVDLIQGGTTRGTNLFHSFDQFSVLTGREAFFNNAADVQNIINRVTGTSISNIDGLIRANGTANLFLLNPNGIVFGPNASLNIGGSFLGSTASSLNFADGTQFSATNSQSPPLLTVSIPIGLQFGPTPGEIIVQTSSQVPETQIPSSIFATGFEADVAQRPDESLNSRIPEFQVQPGKTLAFIGGNVTLVDRTLRAPRGRIELGSVASSSLVSLNLANNGWVLGYESAQNFQDIQLSQGAFVDVSGEGGGEIQIQGRQVTLRDGSQIEASTLGVEPGGTLVVRASEAVELIGTTVDGQSPSALGALVYPRATGVGGNLFLETSRLIVRDGAQILAGTYGGGSAGTLVVKASEAVGLSGLSANGQYSSGLFTTVNTGATGAGGNLTIETGQLILQDGARISTGTEGAGAGGNLTIETGRLILQDGAQVSASTFGEGSAGSLAVRASESVELRGTLASNSQSVSGLFTAVNTGATGTGGTLTLETGHLIIQDGALISASTFGEGSAGSLAVTASDLVEVSGTSANGRISSGLSTSVQPGATGDGGILTIETEQLVVRDGAQI